MEPVSAAAAAKAIVALRRPLMRLAVIVVVAPLALMGGLASIAAAAFGAAQASDTVCDTSDTTAQASMDDPFAQAAADRGLAAPAVAVLSLLADQAQEQLPASVDAAGAYRLPAVYAAGDPGDTGRWRGPVDPAVGQDSRSDPRAATAAVLRRLSRTDAAEWVALRTASQPVEKADVDKMSARYVDLLTAAFPHVKVTAEQVSTALQRPAVAAAAAGDAPTGGALVVGDPTRVDLVAHITGPRLFGGPVRVRPTAADPAAALGGLDRLLAGTRGVVIVASASTPSAEVQADALDATPARVVWLAETGTPAADAGVWVAVGAEQTKDALIMLTAEQDPSGLLFSLCDALPGGGGLDVSTIDPSTIAAPDPAAAVAIAYARSQVGKPYVSDPPRARPPVSWDCSKLTTAAWGQAGVQLTAYSFTQRAQTQPIPQAMVAPGDLVFWLRGGVHHVALVDEVTASGQIWITEAANPTDGVRRRPLGGSWDATYLTGFGRVLRT